MCPSVRPALGAVPRLQLLSQPRYFWGRWVCEGASAPPIVPGGLRWGLETGELAHLAALGASP